MTSKKKANRPPESPNGNLRWVKLRLLINGLMVGHDRTDDRRSASSREVLDLSNEECFGRLSKRGKL
jgi:hypothetical protein